MTSLWGHVRIRSLGFQKTGRMFPNFWGPSLKLGRGSSLKLGRLNALDATGLKTLDYLARITLPKSVAN